MIIYDMAGFKYLILHAQFLLLWIIYTYMITFLCNHVTVHKYIFCETTEIAFQSSNQTYSNV